MITFEEKDIDRKNESEITNKPLSIEQEFCNYCINERNLSESSCRSYVSAIHKAEQFAREHNYNSTALFTENTNEAKNTRKELFEDPLFQELNRLQGSRFSNAIAKLMVFHRTRGINKPTEKASIVTDNVLLSHILPERKDSQQNSFVSDAKDLNNYQEDTIQLQDLPSETIINLSQITKLGDIENFIIKRLKGLSYWGNLGLQKDEYEFLREIISTRIKSESLKSILKLYPVSFTTLAIFLIRYKYNVNFWGLLATELDMTISQNAQKEIGDTFLDSFKEYNFNLDSVKEETRKYLEPLIYQAGFPPDACLNDLFFIIKNDNRGIFDPQSFIEGLISGRSYSIRKHLLKFLENHQKTDAVEYILNVRDAMLAVEQHGTAENGYEIRYLEWKDQEKDRKSKSQKKNNQETIQKKPYLFFEHGRRGLCIVLPQVSLSREYVEETQWSVKGSDGNTAEIYCRVFGGNGNRFIESIAIPVYPASSYDISLKDSENGDAISDFKPSPLPGIIDFVCFDSRGEVNSSGYLPVPFSSFVINKSVVIEEKKNINLIDQSYPKQSGKYNTISVTATSSDAMVMLRSTSRAVRLAAKPRINIFLQGKTLFSLPDEIETKLYTEIPDLVLDLNELAFKQNIEIKIRSKRIPVQCKYDDKEITVELKKYFDSSEMRYGTHSVSLYQNGRLLRNTEFCYVPDISTDYNYILHWPENKKITHTHKYVFERNKDWELDFDNCRVDRNQHEYVVKIPENTAVLRGSLRSMRDDLIFESRFELPLAPLNLEIIDSDENTPKIVNSHPLLLDINEFFQQNKWLAVKTFGRYRDKKYSIVLSNANGFIYSTPIHIRANGEGICSLGVFYDTLKNCVLPAKLEIQCLDYPDFGIPFIVFTDKTTLKDYPVYSKKRNAIAVLQGDGHRKMDFSRFGKDSFVYSISESDWQDQDNVCFHYLQKELPAGIYTLTDNEWMDDLFQFESDSFSNLQQDNPAFLKKDDLCDSYPHNSIHYILPDLLNTIIRKRKLQDLDNDFIRTILNHKIELTKERELNDFEIELLAALGYLVNSGGDESRNQVIKNCMKVISEEILSGIDRTKIIRFLTAMDCPQDVFDICNSSYSLFLFDPDNNNMKPLAEEVEPYLIDLSYLMLIDTNAQIKDTLRLEKYKLLIGDDALANMLGQESIGNPAAKKFLNDEKTGSIHISLSRKISGDLEPLQPISSMYKNSYHSSEISDEIKTQQPIIEIDWKNKVHIHPENIKPDSEFYFNQIRYCDQYINWFLLTHDNSGNIFPETKEKMLRLITKRTCDDITEAKNRLKKLSVINDIFTEYENTLRFRCSNLNIPLTIANLPRYLYFQGLAAFFSRISGNDENSVVIRETGNRFLAKAYEISPRMVGRDILMASTFIYLKKKEVELCR